MHQAVAAGEIDAMEYRKLGETSLSLSVAGFGASPFGDFYESIDPAEAARAVHLAITG
jgi:L-galactose dehydrogenase